MELKFAPGAELLNYNLLGGEENLDKQKFVWIFPDISKTIPPVIPSQYYITSGEAIAKTDKLISDINNTLVQAINLREKLIEARGASKYLELTKCEDGSYSGNIVARKDPKKKKEDK